MNKKQCLLLVLLVAINSATAAIKDYKGIEGARIARQDVMNDIAAGNLEHAKEIIARGPFNQKMKDVLTKLVSDAEKLALTAEVGAGKTKIADLEKQLADKNRNYQALIRVYQAAVQKVNGATRSVEEIQQLIDAAKQLDEELQQQLADNNPQASDSALAAAKADVERLTKELEAKTKALDNANSELAQKKSDLYELNNNLKSPYASGIAKSLKDTAPAELRSKILSLLQSGDAVVATTLPVVLTLSDEALNQVVEIASSNKSVQEQLQLLATDNKNKGQYISNNKAKYSDESLRAQWVIMRGAKNKQKWAEEALASAREAYIGIGTDNNPETMVREPEWAIQTLIVLSADSAINKYAFDIVVKWLDKVEEPVLLSYNGLVSFAIEQAEKGNTRFQKYILEKAVYASWNPTPGRFGTDYGTWSLCAIQLADKAQHAWATTALNKMLDVGASLFGGTYTFVSDKIKNVVSDDKKGKFGGKSYKEQYAEKSAAWAKNLAEAAGKGYVCPIDIKKILDNRTYIDFVVPEKAPEVTPKPASVEEQRIAEVSRDLSPEEQAEFEKYMEQHHDIPAITAAQNFLSDYAAKGYNWASTGLSKLRGSAPSSSSSSSSSSSDESSSSSQGFPATRPYNPQGELEPPKTLSSEERVGVPEPKKGFED